MAGSSCNKPRKSVAVLSSFSRKVTTLVLIFAPWRSLTTVSPAKTTLGWLTAAKAVVVKAALTANVSGNN